MGPTDYGVYGYALSFFMIFRQFVDYGAEDLYLKDIIKGDVQKETIVGSGLLYKYIFAVLSFIVMMVSIIVLKGDDSQIVLIVFILGTSILINPFSILGVSLQADMNFRVLAISRLIGYITISLFKVIVIYYDFGLFFIALAFSLEFFISHFLVMYNKRGILKKMNVSYLYMREFFIKTWPILITIFVIGLNNRLGVFFIKHFGTFENVGHYSVILNLIKFLDFLPMAILMTILPKIIETRERDIKQYNYRFSVIYSMMIYLVLVLFFGAYLLSDIVIPILYGPEFLVVANFLPWGVLATFTTYINFTKAKHFILEGLNREWMIYNAVGMIFICLFLYLLTPSYGILGAISSYSLGYFVSDLFLYIFSQKSREIYHVLLHAFIFPFHYLRKRL